MDLRNAVRRLAAACLMTTGCVSLAQTAEEVFTEDISPIVQSRCVNCHVEGGASGNTRLVFVRSSNADHEALNLQAFENFVADVDGGAERILDKITQRISHGGGVQVADGSERYEDMEGFLALLGQPEPTDELIPDPVLRRAIEVALNKAPGSMIEEAELATVTSLEVGWAGVEDVTGLEYATQLVELHLPGNRFTDLTPLAGLTLLEELDLAYNSRVTDLSALSGLTALRWLRLGGGVSDLSPLAGLTSLRVLYIYFADAFLDFQPLAGIETLTGLWLWWSPNIELSSIAALSGLTTLQLTGAKSLILRRWRARPGCSAST